MQGGNKEPKILQASSIRMVRTEEGKALRKQYENHELQHGFNEYREPELRKDGVTNTLSTVPKDNYVCVAMRGRNPENPSDRTSGVHTEQCLEINQNGTSNTLTSVQKDNLVMQTNNCIDIQYRIRKLTPRECWRLMDFKDYDFEKAQEVNSNTQLYKQAGNSIVKNVLVAIFGQMIDGKENVYKEVV
jgi:DNA (cytosine-5)-methyltransferase 1